MKRKRKIDEDAAPVLVRRKEAIDLTLSDDEDDRTASAFSRAPTIGHNTATTVLSSDDDDVDDTDDIKFVKEASRPPKNCPLAGHKGSTVGIASGTKTINDVLKDKAIKSSSTKSLPPLLLSTPLAVSTHTPCSLHYDILPPELAERLFLRMLDESKTWKKNKWYLNDRLVESTHKTCFYTSTSSSASDGSDAVDDKQWYMGRQATDEEQKVFPNEMEEARSIIEEFVNRQLDMKMEKGERYRLEYDGKWRANVAASNCYKGGSEVNICVLHS